MNWQPCRLRTCIAIDFCNTPKLYGLVRGVCKSDVETCNAKGNLECYDKCMIARALDTRLAKLTVHCSLKPQMTPSAWCLPLRAGLCTLWNMSLRSPLSSAALLPLSQTCTSELNGCMGAKSSNGLYLGRACEPKDITLLRCNSFALEVQTALQFFCSGSPDCAAILLLWKSRPCFVHQRSLSGQGSGARRGHHCSETKLRYCVTHISNGSQKPYLWIILALGPLWGAFEKATVHTGHQVGPKLLSCAKWSYDSPLIWFN